MYHSTLRVHGQGGGGGVRAESDRRTRRVSLHITVAFCGCCGRTMTGRQEQRHNEREQGPALTQTHTHMQEHRGQSASLRPLASQLPSRLLVPLQQITQGRVSLRDL